MNPVKPEPSGSSAPAELGELMQKIDALDGKVDQLAKRSVRTETRLMRLLDHFDLDANGNPIPSPSSVTPKESTS